MKREVLAELLRKIGGASSVGKPFGVLDSSAVTAGEVEQRLLTIRDDEIPIEEQDHVDYIVHIGNNFHHWLDVDRAGPLYSELRRHHQEWLKNLEK